MNLGGSGVGDPVSSEIGSPALRVSNVERVYGGEIALGGVSFDVGPGEIHGLLGANGAGKSTLIRIISGAEAPNGGSVEIFGESIHGVGSAREGAKVAHIHQDRALAPTLSVADNIALSIGYPTRFGFVHRSATHKQALNALAGVGLDLDPRKIVAELSIAEQTLVAIARALASDAQLILLDEPTANLGADDRYQLLERLRTLSAQGVASLLITHSLSEALSVCDNITVLRNGLVAATVSAANTSEEALAELIVGRNVVAERTQARALESSRTPRLDVRNLEAPGIGPLSFSIAPGEILGITGLADSGHQMLGELLFGSMRLIEAEIAIDGETYAPSNPASARSRGFGYVPGDRLRDGLAVDLTLHENLFLDGLVEKRRIPRRAEFAAAAVALRNASVKPPAPDAVLSTLSGGNMQKVLVAKWLLATEKILILSEPTVGVDIGARGEIYRQVREARDRGLAVLLASSDVDEVSLLADRALVLQDGRIIAEVPREGLTSERLTALSSSATVSS